MTVTMIEINHAIERDCTIDRDHMIEINHTTEI